MNKTAPKGPQEVAFLIPDISGFTKFMSSTEISHSRHIIEELIEVIGRETDVFELAEVEGDALLLYQSISAISAEKVEKIAKKAFVAFHQHLLNYEQLRICNCGACSAAVKLSLKFIVHAGKMELATVQGRQKPYGLDVIKAHRLMKNNIRSKEYILFSSDFLNRFSTERINLNLAAGANTYDEIGEVKYQYGTLSHLRKNLKADEQQMALPGRSLKTLASIASEIAAPVSVVYEVLSDFQYRPIWNSDAKIVDQTSDDIYQIGMEHYCIINNKKHQVRTVGNQESKMEFGEQILNTGPFKEFNLYFIFNQSDLNKDYTSLTIELRADVIPFLTPFVNWFMRPKLRKKIIQAMDSIKKISGELAVKKATEPDIWLAG